MAAPEDKTQKGDLAFQLGSIRVEPARNLLISGADAAAASDSLALEPRVVAVLQTLVDAAPDVVTREILLETVWPTSYSADESLTRAVSVLRRSFRALGESAALIETIPKRGYRLTEQPVALPRTAGEAPAETASTQNKDAEGDSVESASVDEATEPSKPEPEVNATVLAPVGRTSRRWIALVAALIMAIGAGSATFFLSEKPPAQEVASDSAKEVPPRVGLKASIAVLPFAALSSDAEDAVFADGLSAQLLSTLAKINDLRVSSRRSSFTYRDNDLPVRAIGDALNVAYLLDGTVQRLGDRSRISASLVSAADGTSLWVESYDRSRDDLAVVQDDIVRKVSRQLAIEFGVGDFAYRSSGEGMPAEAVEQYYLGLGYFGDRMRENDARKRAFEAFRYATELAPEFADAWAALAMVGTSSIASPLARDRDALRGEIEHAFDRALELDDGNAVTHAALAFWHLGYGFDPDEVRRHAERAVSLNPELREAQLAVLAYQDLIGNVPAARAMHERLVARSPDDLQRQLARAAFLAELGETQEAFAFFDECMADNCLQEGFVAFASFFAALADDRRWLQTWRPHWEVFEKALQQVPPSAKPQVAEILPGLFSILADRADKATQIELLRERYATDPVTEYAGLWGPVLASHLPEDDFFAALEASAARGELFSSVHSRMPFYGTNPYPDWVLRHPRYHALFERPELARFAELRRSNGWTDGLPKQALD